MEIKDLRPGLVNSRGADCTGFFPHLQVFFQECARFVPECPDIGCKVAAFVISRGVRLVLLLSGLTEEGVRWFFRGKDAWESAFYAFVRGDSDGLGDGIFLPKLIPKIW